MTEYFCRGCMRHRKQPLKKMGPGTSPRCTVCIEKIEKSSHPEKVHYEWGNGNTVTRAMHKKGIDKKRRKEYLNDKFYIPDEH